MKLNERVNEPKPNMGLKIDKNQLYEKWKRQEGKKITRETKKKKQNETMNEQ